MEPVDSEHLAQNSNSSFSKNVYGPPRSNEDMHRIGDILTRLQRPTSNRGHGRKPRFKRLMIFLVIGCLSIVGFVHVLGQLKDLLKASYQDESDDMDWILHHWGQDSEVTEGWSRWPMDITGGIQPVQCHSHNDYWRSVPLYEAIKSGCTSAEADVWLIEDELYVGHRRFTLASNRTLQDLYLKPLIEILAKRNPSAGNNDATTNDELEDSRHPLNGVFDVDPDLTFVLLIDFKMSGPALWAKLQEQLEPLREQGYLTHFNGTGIVQRPLTVVCSGKAPFDLLIANATHRDAFYDAPLDQLADMSSIWPNPNRASESIRDKARQNQRGTYNIGEESNQVASHDLESPSLPSYSPDSSQASSQPVEDRTYDWTNSYYASVSFTQSVGRVWGSRLTQTQLQLIRGQIRGAHERGLKVRYWSLPAWPIGLRNHIWHILIREGVDMLNVDDLRMATTSDWRRKKGWLY